MRCVAAVLLVSFRMPGAQSPHKAIPFKSFCGSLISVEVGINGTGPYEFALDTGATSSLGDPELTRALSIPYDRVCALERLRVYTRCIARRWSI